jgi:hypothetical protein
MSPAVKPLWVPRRSVCDFVSASFDENDIVGRGFRNRRREPGRPKYRQSGGVQRPGLANHTDGGELEVW